MCHPNRRTPGCVVVLLVGGALLGGRLAAAETPVTDQTVDEAIQHAVQWIKAQRGPEGHWDHGDQGDAYWAGDTSLAMLALLYACENPLSDDMSASLEWLARQSSDRTYVIGARAHVFALAPQRKFRRVLQDDVDWLKRAIGPAGSRYPGAYDYGDSSSSRFDNSNSQYGVLGVWMGTDAGATVPNSYWELVAEHWQREQNGDGGWGYQGTPSTGSMTTAGLASLYVALDRLYVDRPRDARPLVAAIDRGLNWFGRNFDTENPHGDRQYRYYYLYGVERVGRACGRKYFRDVDWFREGASFLLSTQTNDGSWPGQSGGMTSLRNTAFALMFLCHGRAPLLFNKLEHQWLSDEAEPLTARRRSSRVRQRDTEERRAEDDRPRSRWGDEDESAPPSDDYREPDATSGRLRTVVDWNNKLRDVAGLTHFASRRLERLLNWQIVSLDSPLEDLLEAPVLYLNGGLAWEFTDEQVAKLREYCERGGLIFAAPHRRGAAFIAAFKALAERVFPDYPLEVLPAEHPLFNGEIGARLEKPPEVLASSNGMRLLMLICTRDVAEAWHKYLARSREDDLQLGLNVFLYATDKTTQRSRLRAQFIATSQRKTHRKLTVARIRHDGVWDPRTLWMEAAGQLPARRGRYRARTNRAPAIRRTATAIAQRRAHHRHGHPHLERRRARRAAALPDRWRHAHRRRRRRVRRVCRQYERVSGRGVARLTRAADRAITPADGRRPNRWRAAARRDLSTRGAAAVGRQRVSTADELRPAEQHRGHSLAAGSQCGTARHRDLRLRGIRWREHHAHPAQPAALRRSVGGRQGPAVAPLGRTAGRPV